MTDNNDFKQEQDDNTKENQSTEAIFAKPAPKVSNKIHKKY